MSELKPKKRKSIAEPAAAGKPAVPSSRYHPGPTYTTVKSLPHPALDLAGVRDGTKELWLVQLPKQMNMNLLNGASITCTMEDEAPATTSATTAAGATRGPPHGVSGIVKGAKEGSSVRFGFHEETGQLAQQLFVIAGDRSSGSLGMLPLTKRVTLDRIPDPRILPLGVVTEPKGAGEGVGEEEEEMDQEEEKGGAGPTGRATGSSAATPAVATATTTTTPKKAAMEAESDEDRKEHKKSKRNRDMSKTEKKKDRKSEKKEKKRRKSEGAE